MLAVQKKTALQALLQSCRWIERLWQVVQMDITNDHDHPLEAHASEPGGFGDLFTAGSDPLEEAEGETSLWSRFFPRDVCYMKMPVMDALIRRPYHAVILEGKIDLRRLCREHANSLFRTETTIDAHGKPSIARLLLVLEGGAFGFYDEDGLKLYAPTRDVAATLAKDFRRYVRHPREDKPQFYVVSIAEHGPVAEAVKIDRPAPVNDVDLLLNYGGDCVGWVDKWLACVSSHPSGLTVLHGPPGTGKTSFLRALMGRLLGTARFFYVPVSEAQMLSSPRFVNFWISQTRRHKGKIKFAILEDAEEMLVPREPGTSDKVSNLLNISDGLLGDHLRLHVMATTNVPVSQLDPAIIRPGRLVGAREFRRLTRAEAERLAVAKGLALPEKEKFTLAEIYGGGGGQWASGNGRKIGFT